MRAEQQNEAPQDHLERKSIKDSTGNTGQQNQMKKKKQKKEKLRSQIVRYDQDNMKECFMERLVMTLNAAEITQEQMSKLGAFKGILKSEWNRIKHIVYHSKEEPTCSICLQTTFTAPQITSCGHVFCWPCIFMHSQKSLKAVFCPVCNQAYDIAHIVTCRPVYSRSFPLFNQNKVRFALKGRRDGDNRIYDYDTLAENLQFSRVIRGTPQKILSLFQDEKKQIQEAFKICEDQIFQENLKKILICSQNKIKKARELSQKKENRHHNRRDRLQNGYYHSLLDKRQKNKLITFYQEHSGRMIYLHPICDKLIRKSTKELPLIIEQEILQWQDTQYSFELLKYYQISHLTVNQEIDLVIVDIEPLLEDKNLKEQFRKELQRFKKQKMKEQERQQKQSARLSAQYKKKQKIKIEIQKMEEDQLGDIQLPGPVDQKEIENPSLFPSLFETRSLPDPQQRKMKMKKENGPVPQEQDDILENEDYVPDIILRKESDPDAFFDIPSVLLSTKSEDVFVSENEKRSDCREEGKKKKKEYVNVTGLFFNSSNAGGSI